MKNLILVLAAALTTTANADLNKPIDLDCSPMDVAQTRISIKSNLKTLELSVQSYALMNLITGAKLPSTVNDWSPHKIKIEAFPIGCTQSAKRAELIACQFENLTITSFAIDPTTRKETLGPITFLNWITIGTRRITVEDAAGNKSYTTVLDVAGYGEAGAVTLQAMDGSLSCKPAE